MFIIVLFRTVLVYGTCINTKCRRKEAKIIEKERIVTEAMEFCRFLFLPRLNGLLKWNQTNQKHRMQIALTTETLLTTSLATAKPWAKVRAATNARVICSFNFRGTSPKGFSCSVYLLTHSRYSSVKWYCEFTRRNIRSKRRAQKSFSISSRFTFPTT